MESKKILAILAVVIVVIAGIGIGVSVMNKGDSTAKDTLSIGIANKNGYDPLIYALEAGYFEDEGLEVTVKWDENGGLTTAALLAGQVDMTNAGTTPVINAVHKSSNIKVVASNCFDKIGKSSMTVIALKTQVDDGSLNLGNLKGSFFDASGNYNGKTIGMAYASGYSSSWLKFVQWEAKAEGLTDAQVTILTTLNGAGGAIMDLGEASTGVTNLLSVSPTVSIVIGGSDIDVVGNYPDKLAYLQEPSEYLTEGSAVGGVYIVSEKAYNEKKSAIEKALRAIKKAAAAVNDVSDNGKDSEYFSKLLEYTTKHGAYANETALLNAVQKRYWGMFLVNDVFDYYNKAEASNAETHVEGFDLEKSFTNEFLKKIYGDEPYILDRATNTWSK
jgi:ABC-type nitrate/sulfonate/bicarbonate transport system substrate-binding protein